MAIYSIVQEIEDIFDRDIYDNDWERDENSTTHTDLFYKTFFGSMHVNKGEIFWKYYNLTEVFGIARSNKWAFYMAYNYNIAGFHKFCNKFWNE